MRINVDVVVSRGDGIIEYNRELLFSRQRMSKKKNPKIRCSPTF